MLILRKIILLSFLGMSFFYHTAHAENYQCDDKSGNCPPTPRCYDYMGNVCACNSPDAVNLNVEQNSELAVIQNYDVKFTSLTADEHIFVSEGVGNRIITPFLEDIVILNQGSRSELRSHVNVSIENDIEGDVHLGNKTQVNTIDTKTSLKGYATFVTATQNHSPLEKKCEDKNPLTPSNDTYHCGGASMQTSFKAGNISGDMRYIASGGGLIDEKIETNNITGSVVIYNQANHNDFQLDDRGIYSGGRVKQTNSDTVNAKMNMKTGSLSKPIIAQGYIAINKAIFK